MNKMPPKQDYESRVKGKYGGSLNRCGRLGSDALAASPTQTKPPK